MTGFSIGEWITAQREVIAATGNSRTADVAWSTPPKSSRGDELPVGGGARFKPYCPGARYCMLTSSALSTSSTVSKGVVRTRTAPDPEVVKLTAAAVTL